jgi:hypothetical protein
MMEFMRLFIFICFVINGHANRNTRCKAHNLDAELKQLIQESNVAAATGVEIKRFLLDFISYDSNALEKLSDTGINQAQRIFDRTGSESIYRMNEIAAQLSIQAAARVYGIPTNVNAGLGACATPDAVVNIVVIGHHAGVT